MPIRNSELRLSTLLIFTRAVFGPGSRNRAWGAGPRPPPVSGGVAAAAEGSSVGSEEEGAVLYRAEEGLGLEQEAGPLGLRTPTQDFLFVDATSGDPVSVPY